MDTRLEVREIWKHFGRYHNDVGETLLYYKFDSEISAFDRVYDEGNRRYHTAVRIPILWVDQQEATEDYSPEGRRPTTRLRLSVSARDMYEAGVSVTEAHGNRLQDDSPSDIWREDRVHDILYYNGRYWEVSAFQIRGRVKGEDVIIGISAIETFPGDDMIFDYVPGSPLPVLPAGYGSGPYGSGPYGGTT
jgi:hypothetical protein